MASTIGTILCQDDGPYGDTLKTLTVRANIRLVPTGETGDKPTHRIYAESGFKPGAAWTKTKKDNGGGTHLSLKFDAPEPPRSFRRFAARGAKPECQGDPSKAHNLMS